MQIRCILLNDRETSRQRTRIYVRKIKLSQCVDGIVEPHLTFSSDSSRSCISSNLFHGRKFVKIHARWKLAKQRDKSILFLNSQSTHASFNLLYEYLITYTGGNVTETRINQRRHLAFERLNSMFVNTICKIIWRIQFTIILTPIQTNRSDIENKSCATGHFFDPVMKNKYD